MVECEAVAVFCIHSFSIDHSVEQPSRLFFLIALYYKRATICGDALKDAGLALWGRAIAHPLQEPFLH